MEEANGNGKSSGVEVVSPIQCWRVQIHLRVEEPIKSYKSKENSFYCFILKFYTSSTFLLFLDLILY